jgi:hypothetical protein
MGWIESRIEQQQRAIERTQTEAELQLRRTRLIAAKGREAWRYLVGTLEMAVASYRSALPDPENTVTFQFKVLTVLISRTFHPSRTLSAEFDEGAGVIRFEHVLAGKETSGVLTLAVDAQDDLYFRRNGESGDADWASRVLLEPVLFG